MRAVTVGALALVALASAAHGDAFLRRSRYPVHVLLEGAGASAAEQRRCEQALRDGGVVVTAIDGALYRVLRTASSAVVDVVIEGRVVFHEERAPRTPIWALCHELDAVAPGTPRFPPPPTPPPVLGPPRDRFLALIAGRTGASIHFQGSPLWGGGLSILLGSSSRFAGRGEEHRGLVLGAIEAVGGRSQHGVSTLRVGIGLSLGAQFGRLRLLIGPRLSYSAIYATLHEGAVRDGADLGLAGQASFDVKRGRVDRGLHVLVGLGVFSSGFFDAHLGLGVSL